jgi:hypothetical protein
LLPNAGLHCGQQSPPYWLVPQSASTEHERSSVGITLGTGGGADAVALALALALAVGVAVGVEVAVGIGLASARGGDSGAIATGASFAQPINVRTVA